MSPNSIFFGNHDYRIEFEEIYTLEITSRSSSKEKDLEIKFNLYSGQDKIIRANDLVKAALPEILLLSKEAGVTINDKRQ
ncbi:MAG: hypothetical protein R8G33_02530 [Gammaproteobacteria bacterium]|nr:hypothetical protein [Gammaproteobacteria bacterium]